MLGKPFHRYEFKDKDWCHDGATLTIERQGIPKSGIVYFSISGKDASKKHPLFGMTEARDLRNLAELLIAFAEKFEKEYPIEDMSCKCAVYKKALELACKPVTQIWSTAEGWIEQAKKEIKNET